MAFHLWRRGTAGHCPPPQSMAASRRGPGVMGYGALAALVAFTFMHETLGDHTTYMGAGFSHHVDGDETGQWATYATNIACSGNATVFVDDNTIALLEVSPISESVQALFSTCSGDSDTVFWVMTDQNNPAPTLLEVWDRDSCSLNERIPVGIYSTSERYFIGVSFYSPSRSGNVTVTMDCGSARPTANPPTVAPSQEPTTLSPTGYPTSSAPTGYPTSSAPTASPTSLLEDAMADAPLLQCGGRVVGTTVNKTDALGPHVGQQALFRFSLTAMTKITVDTCGPETRGANLIDTSLYLYRDDPYLDNFTVPLCFNDDFDSMEGGASSTCHQAPFGTCFGQSAASSAIAANLPAGSYVIAVGSMNTDGDFSLGLKCLQMPTLQNVLRIQDGQNLTTIGGRDVLGIDGLDVLLRVDITPGTRCLFTGASDEGNLTFSILDPNTGRVLITDQNSLSVLLGPSATALTAFLHIEEARVDNLLSTGPRFIAMNCVTRSPTTMPTSLPTTHVPTQSPSVVPSVFTSSPTSEKQPAASTSSSDASGSHSLTIGGAAAGGLILILMVVFLILRYRRRSGKSKVPADLAMQRVASTEITSNSYSAAGPRSHMQSSEEDYGEVYEVIETSPTKSGTAAGVFTWGSPAKPVDSTGTQIERMPTYEDADDDSGNDIYEEVASAPVGQYASSQADEYDTMQHIAQSSRGVPPINMYGESENGASSVSLFGQRNDGNQEYEIERLRRARERADVATPDHGSTLDVQSFNPDQVRPKASNQKSDQFSYEVPGDQEDYEVPMPVSSKLDQDQDNYEDVSVDGSQDLEQYEIPVAISDGPPLPVRNHNPANNDASMSQSTPGHDVANRVQTDFDEDYELPIFMNNEPPEDEQDEQEMYDTVERRASSRADFGSIDLGDSDDSLSNNVEC